MSKTVSAHLAYQTDFTRTGVRNMKNRKPYRTAAQKRTARKAAVKSPDGTYRAATPVSYHK